MEQSKKDLQAKRRKNLKRRKILIITGESLLVMIVFLMCYAASIMGKVQWNSSDTEFYQPKHETKNAQSELQEAESKDQEADIDETQEKDGSQQNVEAISGLVNADNIENYSSFMEGYTTILVVGMDTRDKADLINTTENSDVIMIVNINNETSEVRMISVYRDTYMRLFSNGEYDKVNRETALSGVNNLVNMLNYNLDLSIDYYVVVNWAAAAQAVNALGGVEMELTAEEVGADNPTANINGYIVQIIENTGISGEPIWEPGLMNLDGVQAVAYCRIRYVGSDYGRTERQRKVIGKMLEKAQTADFSSLTALVDNVLPNVSTNLSKTEVLSLAMRIKDYKIAAQSTFPSTVYSDEMWCGNIPITYPVVADDFEKNVSELHKFLFDVSDYQPTAEVKEVSDYIKQISGWSEQ